MESRIIDKAISLADTDRSGISRSGLYIIQALRKYWELRCVSGRTLRKNHIGAQGKSTFFILGSGASICNLTTKNLLHIKDNISVGINTWPLHPFVPDIYAFEYFREPGNKVKTLSLALKRKEVAEKRPYFIIKDSALYAPSEQCVKIPRYLKSRVLYYTSVPLLTRDPTMLKKAFRDFMQLHSLGLIPSYCMPDRGASIVRLAGLGVLSGFNKIVFVGVDLNNTNYFWEEDENIIQQWHTHELSSGQTGKVHKTNDPQEKRFTVTEVLEAIEEVARTDYGISMQTASHESALTSFMRVYRFPS